MTELDEAKAREEFPTILDRVVDGKERVVLTRHGKPVAVLVPAEDWEQLVPDEEHRPDPAALQRFEEMVAAARAAKKDEEKDSPWEAIKRDPEWQRQWDEVLARIQSHIPPELTEEEIEAEVRAAREEVRAERRARRRSGGYRVL